MNRWHLLMTFCLLLFISCSQNSTKGVRCATGKLKKTKSYKLKKIKPYIKGYPGGGEGPVPDYAKREKNEVNKIQTASINENTTLDSIPVSIEVSQQKIKQQQLKDTIRRTIVERRKATTSNIEPEPPTQTIITTQSPKKRDTLRKTVIERRTAELPANNLLEETPIEDKKDTLKRTKTIRKTSPSPVNPKSITSLIDISDSVSIIPKYNPVTQFLFKNQVFEKEEDFEYREQIMFVPNYDILLYPDDAKNELDSLITLLKRFPEKKVFIYGNGGFDNIDGKTDTDIKYREIIVGGDPYIGYFTSIAKNHFGKGDKVYKMNFFFLGNIDPHELKRIKEEERKEMDPYSPTNIGQLLLARAKRIERLLIESGINKNRIISKKGEFLPHPNNNVLIRVYND